jgi:hypothetical protein
MTRGIVILMGHAVWIRGAAGWRRESYEGVSESSTGMHAHLGEMLREDKPRKWTLVYEPEGIIHQTVETPRVSRRVFASLERIRNEFPVVESENLGWGMECPEPTLGGTFSTLLHAEVTPGLAHLRDVCHSSGSRLDAAWPLYTSAVACAQTGGPEARSRFMLVLARDFVAVVTCIVGKRSFKAWSGPMSDRDWKAASILIGDADARSSATMSDLGQRRGGIAVVADGEPKKLCPLWDEILSSGRIGTVMNMDALAAGASRIRRNHPANMAEAFPMPRNLDKCFLGAISAGVLTASALGVGVLGVRTQLEVEHAASQGRVSFLGKRLETLKRNQTEMDLLRGEMPEDPDFMRTSRHAALVELSATVPDALTLEVFGLRKDNRFELEAVVVGAVPDLGSLRKALERCGFESDPRDGWVFDSSSGRLVIRGRLTDRRT